VRIAVLELAQICLLSPRSKLTAAAPANTARLFRGPAIQRHSHAANVLLVICERLLVRGFGPSAIVASIAGYACAAFVGAGSGHRFARNITGG